MDDDQQFCLRWNNHQSTLISVFDSLLENETLVDCTLAAEGKFLKAHKVVLSACSPYFATLLQEQYDKHPIFILKDVKYQELRAMMDYMYRGEVNISQDQLAALLKAAESLQIKGLSDNRSGSVPKTEHHRATGLNVPVGGGGNVGKIAGGGYTLEQTKRARVGPSSMDSQEMSGSREGSSSPSRRRRKVRRRSIENVMTEVHDNSNSSQIQSNQSSAMQAANASLAGVGAITAAASALASQIPVSAAAAAAAALQTAATSGAPITGGSNQGTQAQQLTAGVNKKTESVKGTSDAMNTTDNALQSVGVGGDDQDLDTAPTAGTTKIDKQNHHKQKLASSVSAGGTGAVTVKESTEMVIEPKSEYDDDGNDETVEDLTLDEDMGMDDLDQNAGTSQGGEGSSQGYAPWQHDRSQDELLLATQEAQQRDPQDLSITRIAGLTWNEWNARLAMPLVTQLREGPHPLVFPTDLSLNTLEKQNVVTMTKTTSKASGADSDAAAAGSGDEETPGPVRDRRARNTKTPTDALVGVGVSSTPLNCRSNSSAEKAGVKLKPFTDEEATALFKAAAEKSAAAAANNSGNMSDNSYTEDNGNLSGSGGVGASDYHSALSGAGAFADVGGAAGLCNINILNSISAMNSLIGSAGGGNGGISISGGGLTVTSGGGIGGGGGSSSGHTCPDCGRGYKLKSSLRNHQKWECGKEPQFQCPFCVYRAKQKMHIGRHMERMHKEKCFKLEDLKSFTTGGSGDDSSGTAFAAAAAAAAAGALATAAELRQHFS